MAKGELILITGGARSGKSRMALQIAGQLDPRIFLATAEARDEEMRERINAHKKERGQNWMTVEEPIAVGPVLQSHPDGVLVLDCLTLWLCNLLEHSLATEEILAAAKQLCIHARNRDGTTVIVTNEVGMGIVPASPVGRLFVDLAGKANQEVAAAADKVIFMVSGLPLSLK